MPILRDFPAVKHPVFSCRLAALVASVLAGMAAGCGDRFTSSGSPGGAPAGAATPGSPTPAPVVRVSSNGEMVLIPAGKFVMGDAAGAADEGPPHEVEISAFFMDRFEVTQARFEETTGYNPAKRDRKGEAVDQVRWTEAIDYCNQRSKREGLEPCYDLTTGDCRFEANGYRLPTEAEWEYACRAGTSTRWFTGGKAAGLEAFAWFDKNARRIPARPARRSPTPGGSSTWREVSSSGATIATLRTTTGKARGRIPPGPGKERTACSAADAGA